MTKFTKMHGLGNDFVVIEGEVPDTAQIKSWCDRRRGIGADGVLLVGPAPSMHYWNADGSEAEMCGNGFRCVARYATERGWAPVNEWFTVETPVGPRQALVEDDVVTVELGRVELGEVNTIDGCDYQSATIGNPHAVRLVDAPEQIDVAAVGSRIAANPVYPHGSNVEFVAVEAPDRVRMRVWERGVGETDACGTGMVVAAAVAAGMDRSAPVTVKVPGGEARVFFRDGISYLQGPAVTAFTGQWSPS